MKRRNFFQNSSVAAGIAIGANAPTGWLQTLASDVNKQEKGSDRILVVIQLSGGNDGLNSIVPHRHDRYLKARPKLRIHSDDVVPLEAELGMHPSLRPLESLIESKQFSIVQGVGYEKPNRSHFESMDIWHSCQHKFETSRTSTTRVGPARSGWLGRLFQQESFKKQIDAPALHLGNETLPLALVEKGIQIPSIASLEQFRWKNDSTQSTMLGEESSSELLDFVSTGTESAMQASRRVETALSEPDQQGDFPSSALGEKLRSVSRLILAGLQTSVYYVTLDGFDTHANQLAAHAGLLRQWSEALAAFHARLTKAGQAERVLTMTFSEFGRRVAENASLGTDHGAAAPMFFSGAALPELMVGQMPSLEDLDDGDLKYQIDFRSVYRSVVEDWFGLDVEAVRLASFPKIALSLKAPIRSSKIQE